MTIDSWLSQCEPTPPEALLAGIVGEVGHREAGSAEDRCNVLLDGAVSVLARLNSGGWDDRRSAVGLLVADAMVTYAFEAAGESPATLELQATSAMNRLAEAVGGVE
jgi:hypothetical protein